MEVVEGVATIDDVGAFVTTLDELAEQLGVTVQAFDARYVVDRAHLDRAVELARRADERDDRIADDFGVEILLYAAGRRQIAQALEMGVSEGECPVVAVVVDRAAAGTTDTETAAAETLRDALDPRETLGTYDAATVRDFFDVSDTELGATEGSLADAVRERVALLPVEK